MFMFKSNDEQIPLNGEISIKRIEVLVIDFCVNHT